MSKPFLSCKQLTVPATDPPKYVHLNSRAVDIQRSLPSRLRSKWVFATLEGTSALNPNNFLNRIFRPALAQAGIENFHWHDLRHTYGSRLAMQRVPLFEIQRLLRHRSSRMTERYAHLAPQRLSEAVEALVDFEDGTDTNTSTHVHQTGEHDAQDSRDTQAS